MIFNEIAKPNTTACKEEIVIEKSLSSVRAQLVVELHYLSPDVMINKRKGASNSLLFAVSLKLRHQQGSDIFLRKSRHQAFSAIAYTKYTKSTFFQANQTFT